MSEPKDPTGEQSNGKELTQRVQQLEEECRRQRETIAKLEHERDLYVQALYSWHKSQMKPEDWDDFDPADYTAVTTEEVMEFLGRKENNEQP